MNRTFLFCSAAALTIGCTLVQAQPKPKSQKEVAVLQKMFSATDPDARIAAAEDLLNNFADSEFKPYALLAEAESYEAKGSYEKTIVAGERALEADPKQFVAMLILSRQYIGHVRENDLDKEDKLTKGEKYSNDALAAIQSAKKMNPGLSDADWEAAKKQSSAEADEALGMAAMARKKLPDAEEYFKKAVELTNNQNPALMVRLASAYNKEGKYDLALAELDKVKTAPNMVPAIEQVAGVERDKATKGKAAGAPKP
jgi:tetratricopeptide (TPR) repeat protein